MVSNVAVVAKAEDGSLWAMGMGEHDRNTFANPIRVQTDFHLYLDESGQEVFPAKEEGEGLVGEIKTVFLRLPDSARLKKGHKRVSVIFDADGDGCRDGWRMVTTAESGNSCFDVVLHEGEAYLLEIDIDRCPGAVKALDGGERYRIRDYSAGWMHSLMLIDRVDL